MEIKKSPKADLQNKKGIFLQIGMICALGVVILMFNWSQSEKVVVKMTDDAVAVEEEMVEITRQEQKPPEVQAPKTLQTVSDILAIVKNDVKVTTDYDFSSEFTEDAIVVAPAKVKEELVADDVPFMRAEVMPTFNGGDLNTFREWVQNKLTYPFIAAENGVQGTVVLKFVVDKTGSISRVEVLASPDKSLADEAVRVVKTSPKWTPGKQRGNPVSIEYTMPVKFVLQ